MCGIWAIFGTSEDISDYFNCALKIAHRGPDCFRLESIPNFGNSCLAFHRLAVVDSVYGMQPMRVFSLPHLYVIYNGEIYNHKALGKQYGFNYHTKCDGEVILHLYNQFGGAKTAQMMDGVFAFVVVDTTKKEIHLGRDTFGVRPMFMLKTGDQCLAICSEVKGLLKLQKDLDGIKSVIEPFRPGHHASLSFNDDGVATIKKMAPYTSLTKIPEFDFSVKVKSDIKENIRALFTEAVRKRLMSDRRIGCLLSGGLDSSLVTAVLVKLARESGISYPIQTFSVGMTGSTDLAAARKVADFLSTEHHELVFTPEEGLAAIPDVIEYLESYDITTVRASVGMYLISKYIREKTDTVVIFSGEGSDELAQGYIYFHKAPSAEEADVESKRLLEDLYLYDVLRGDRSTAAHGLEIRVPFLDVAFTSYFLSLTPSIRQPHEKVEKYLLRSAFDEEGLLPNEILWRPKEAFSDGVSSTKAGESWYEIIQKHCKRIVSDIKLETAAERYPFSTPKTKEAYYYRKIFENKYPGQSHLIPYMWLPKWSDSQDPSARTLAHYTQE